MFKMATEKNLDGFAGGITQPTPRFQKQHPGGSEPPRPRYSDEWANSSAGFNPPAPNVDEIVRKTHR
jgi:hypothetical protein